MKVINQSVDGRKIIYGEEHSIRNLSQLNIDEMKTYHDMHLEVLKEIF